MGLPAGLQTPISVYPWQTTIWGDHHNTQLPIGRAQKSVHCIHQGELGRETRLRAFRRSIFITTIIIIIINVYCPQLINNFITTFS